MAVAHNLQTLFQANSKVVSAIFVRSSPKIPELFSDVFNIVEADPNRPFFNILPIIGLGPFALKGEGEVPVVDQAYEGTMIEAIFSTYALMYKITDEASREDAKRLLSKLPAMLQYSEQISVELLVWQMFALAFSGSVLGPDGVSLCSTAHPLAGQTSGTYSNSLGAMGLTPEALQQGFILMEGLVDDRGMPIFRTPRRLIVPKELHRTAEEIVASPYFPYSNENRVNVVANKVEPYVSRFLPSPTAWFLSAGKGDLEGDSHSLMVSFKARKREWHWVDPATRTANQASLTRLAYVWADGRGIVGSQGA